MRAFALCVDIVLCVKGVGHDWLVGEHDLTSAARQTFALCAHMSLTAPHADLALCAL